MKLSKIVFTSLATLGLSSISLLANAGDLHLVNNTDKDSTSVINGGFCSSSLLGKDGITKAHGTNTIGDFLIRAACFPHGSNCKADVYMTDNCTGEKVATVTLSVDTGITGVMMSSQGYKIIANGFNVQMDPVA